MASAAEQRFVVAATAVADMLCSHLVHVRWLAALELVACPIPIAVSAQC